MSDFTKTLIVDDSITLNDPPEDPTYPSPPYFNTIKKAADYFIEHSIGGVIIVEQGTYTFDQTDDYPTNTNWDTTVVVPSNVTIIGRGNAVIEVTENVSAFRNSGFYEEPQESNERITISGFKIIVKYDNSSLYTNNVVDFEHVDKCLIEKLYITYDQSCTNGINRGYGAISIYGDKAETPVTYSRDNIISQCTVKDYGKVKTVGEVDYNNFGIGIMLHTKCERNMIKNNYVSRAALGCYVDGGEYSTVSCNIFRKSIGVFGEGPAGMIIGASNNSTIVGNQFNNNSTHGLYLPSSEGCTILGNVNTNNGSAGADGHGLRMGYAASKFNTVTGNIFHGNNTSGIQLGGAANLGAPWYITLSGNSCCNNNDYGIYLSTSVCGEEGQPACEQGHSPEDDKVKHITIVGNVCHGNTDGTIQYTPAHTDDIVEADNMTS